MQKVESAASEKQRWGVQTVGDLLELLNALKDQGVVFDDTALSIPDLYGSVAADGASVVTVSPPGDGYHEQRLSIWGPFA